MTEWPERLAAVRKIDGSRRALGPIIEMFIQCLPSSKLVPGGNTGELKAARKGLPPHLTMPTVQDKYPLKKALPNVRNRTWDSPLSLPL